MDDPYARFRKKPDGGGIATSDPYSRFRKKKRAAPGETPETAMNEGGLGFGERLAYGNLAPNNPDSLVNWLRKRNYEAQKTAEGDVVLRKPGGRWKRPEKNGADWMDVLDWGDEALSMLLSGAGMVAGGILGTGATPGPGTVAGASAGGAAGSLVAEGAKEGLAKAVGFEDQGTGTNMVVEGLAGAAGPLLPLGVAKAFKGTPGVKRMVVRMAGPKGAVGKIPSVAPEAPKPVAPQGVMPVVEDATYKAPRMGGAYTETVEVDAKALKDAVERETGEAFGERPDRMAGMAGKESFDAYPRLTVGADGKLHVPDGRNRIATAAARGLKIPVAIPPAEKEELLRRLAPQKPPLRTAASPVPPLPAAAPPVVAPELQPFQEAVETAAQKKLVANRDLDSWTNVWNNTYNEHVAAGKGIPGGSIPRMPDIPKSAFQVGVDNVDSFLEGTDTAALQELAHQLGAKEAFNASRENVANFVKKKWAVASDILVDRRHKGWAWLNETMGQPFQVTFLKRVDKEAKEPGGWRNFFGTLNAPVTTHANIVPKEEIRAATAHLPLSAPKGAPSLEDIASRIREKYRGGFRGEKRPIVSPARSDKKMAAMDRDQLLDWIFKNQKGVFVGNGAIYDGKQFGVRWVWDLEHKAWRSVPLDWTYRLQKAGEAPLYMLEKGAYQAPGARGTIGRGLVKAGQALGAPARKVSSLIEGAALKTGLLEKLPQGLGLMARKGLGLAPIYGAPLAAPLAAALPGAVTAGTTLAAGHALGGVSKALGRAIMRDSGGLLSRLLHANAPPAVQKVAKMLHAILRKDGMEAYRDAFLAQMVMDPAFRQFVEGG